MVASNMSLSLFDNLLFTSSDKHSTVFNKQQSEATCKILLKLMINYQTDYPDLKRVEASYQTLYCA